MSHSSHRKKQVILPSFQLRLAAKFLCLSLGALLCQFLFMGILLTNVMRGFPGAEALLPEVPAIVFKTVLFTAVLQLPILCMGLIMTFRVAGPVYRFESYLRSLARGDHGGPCKIRDKDEFSSLNEAINEVALRMDELRNGQAAPAARADLRQAS
jgi:hypothetical protein